MNRLILLTYTFPPAADGSTRALMNLCRHLPDNGWEVIPVTAKDPAGTHQDQSLAERIPKGSEVIRVIHGKPGFPSSLLHRLNFIRENYVHVPDRVITWKDRVVPVLRELAAKRKPHCIVSMGPPHSLHLIAGELAAKTDIPHIPFFSRLWLADRDVQWPSRINRFMEGLQEKALVRKARGIIASTEGSCGYFVNRYGDRCPRTFACENAYDPEVMGRPAEPRPAGEFLTAGWSGDFQEGSAPEEMFSGLSMFYERNPHSRLKVRLTGAIDPLSAKRLSKRPYSGRVEHLGRIPWKETPVFLKGCDLLIDYLGERQWNDLKTTVNTPEYLISGRPILAMVPTGGDMAKRVRQYGNGYVCAPVAPEIAIALEEIEYQWKTTGLKVPYDFHAIEQKFSAPRVIPGLAAFLDGMAAP